MRNLIRYLAKSSAAVKSTPTKATFLAGLVLAAHAHAGDAPSLSEQIDQALALNASAASYEEWLQLGLTSERLFEKVAEQKDTHAWDSFCKKLRTLATSDLAFFEGEILNSGFSTRLPCQSELKSRLETYWRKTESSMNDDRIGLAIEEDEGKLPSSDAQVDAESGPVFFDGGLKQGEIAITIDDGPHPIRTKRILATLGEFGVRATFFCVGENAKRYPDLVKAELQGGHSVGSHSWNHPQLPATPLERAEENIVRGHEAVLEATSGLAAPFFRFPYGAKNKSLESFVRNSKMASFLWNMDSSDWKIRDPRALLKNAITQVDRHKGGIILFHDIQEQTAIMLGSFLEELRHRKFTTVAFVPRPQAAKPLP